MPSVVQHLLDSGLPLQAATQLSLWAQRDDPARPPTVQAHHGSLAAPAVEEDDDSSAFEAARPISAVVKLRAASTATASSSRPRSSIGMSRALSPVAAQSAAAAAPPRSPPASITSSTPTNIIVRSFRDIEHRAQLMQRAKTSAARIMSSQPLVIPNVRRTCPLHKPTHPPTPPLP